MHCARPKRASKGSASFHGHQTQERRPPPHAPLPVGCAAVRPRGISQCWQGSPHLGAVVKLVGALGQAHHGHALPARLADAVLTRVRHKGFHPGLAEQVALRRPGQGVHVRGKAQGGQRARSCMQGSAEAQQGGPSGSRRSITAPLPSTLHRADNHHAGSQGAPGRWVALTAHTTVRLVLASAAARPRATAQLPGRKMDPKLHPRGRQEGVAHACTQLPCAGCTEPAACGCHPSTHLASTMPRSPAWSTMRCREGCRGLGSWRTNRGPTICRGRGRGGVQAVSRQGAGQEPQQLCRQSALGRCMRKHVAAGCQPSLALSLGGRLRGVLSPQAAFMSSRRAPWWAAGAVGATGRLNSWPRRCAEASATGTVRATAILDTTALMRRSRNDCEACWWSIPCSAKQGRAHVGEAFAGRCRAGWAGCLPVERACRCSGRSRRAARSHQRWRHARGNEGVHSRRVGEAVQRVPKGVGDLDGGHPHQRHAQHLCKQIGQASMHVRRGPGQREAWLSPLELEGERLSRPWAQLRQGSPSGGEAAHVPPGCCTSR